MKQACLLTAALAAFLSFPTVASAQQPGARDGHGARHDRGGGDRAWARGGDRGRWSPSSAGRYVSRGYYRGGFGPGYYAPWYASPFYYGTPYYSVPLYASAPPPVVYERYYIEDAPAEPAPPPVQRSYSERSYAQITPPPPAQPEPPQQRFERVTLSARELFGFDQAKLRMPQPKLDEIAQVLVRNPQIGAVTITGYTDRIGTESYNMKLSQRRAEAVKAYLTGKGVPASRLNTVGKGEANPVVQCNDKKMADLIKCLEPNRRVEVEQITIERRVP